MYGRRRSEERGREVESERSKRGKRREGWRF